MSVITRVSVRISGKTSSTYMKPFHLCLLHGFSLITILDIFNSPKKPDVSEQDIRLNEERFERILKSLSSISKHLKAQLQRKTLILGNYFHIT